MRGSRKVGSGSLTPLDITTFLLYHQRLRQL